MLDTSLPSSIGRMTLCGSSLQDEKRDRLTLQVTFLGTAAAPSMPIPFCVCQTCSDARRAAGKNLRKRSSMAINDDLLVDIGPDIATASFAHDVSLTDIRICLLTHAHADHFDPEFLMSRHEEYATVVAQELLLAGSSDTLRSIDEVLGERCEYGSIFNQDTQRTLKINPADRRAVQYASRR